MDARRILRGLIMLIAPCALLASMAPIATADDDDTTLSWSVFTRNDSVLVRFNYHDAPDRDTPYTCTADIVGTKQSVDMNTVTYGTVEFTGVSEGTHTVSATCENESGSQSSVGRILFQLPGPDKWHLVRTQHAIID